VIKELKVKSAIHFHDSKFASNWDLNIYRGCEHRCKYCFAQYSHKYLNNGEYEFFGDIFIKTNIAEILDKELSKKSWKPTNILNICGITDCYQPVEEKYQLMKDVLKVLIKHKQSVFILTKSPLILRDYDLIKELSEVAYVNIAFTITTLDEDIRQKIEPNVKSSMERLLAMKEFSELNCKTVIMLMPIIPYLTDTTKNIENIFKISKEFGCNFLLSAPLNMRGFVKPNFYDFLKKDFPNTYQNIQKLYKGAYSCKEYNEKLRKFLYQMRIKYKMLGSGGLDKSIEEYTKKFKPNEENDLFNLKSIDE
jgi:DNA repair photolyase